MSRRFGFELLVEQAAQSVAEQVSSWAAGFESSPHFGDTPIERLLFGALCVHLEFGELEWPWKVKSKYAEHKELLHALLYERQVEIDDIGRVDFLFEAYGDWARSPDEGKEGWRRLIVECDGHDFHERTKEQAAKDRSRDRAAVLAGIDVLRFTGSELWRDPWGCAGQIIAWANRGV